jgi:hypothetical protein
VASLSPMTRRHHGARASAGNHDFLATPRAWVRERTAGGQLGAGALGAPAQSSTRHSDQTGAAVAGSTHPAERRTRRSSWSEASSWPLPYWKGCCWPPVAAGTPARSGPAAAPRRRLWRPTCRRPASTRCPTRCLLAGRARSSAPSRLPVHPRSLAAAPGPFCTTPATSTAATSRCPGWWSSRRGGPPGGRPVAVWTHGSSGLADRCAPSHAGVMGALGPGLGGTLQQDLVVAATDY